MNPFQIMSEPVRRRLVEVLCVGEHSFGELADVVTAEFGVTRATTSWHLAILRRADWVATRDDWPRVMYGLEEGALKRLRAEVRHYERLRTLRYGFHEKRGAPTTMTGSDHSGRGSQRAADSGQQAGRPGRARALSGTAKGLRGRGRDDNPWRPRA